MTPYFALPAIPPWLAMIGLVLGFAAAGREVYRIYRLYLAEEEEERKKRR